MSDGATEGHGGNRLLDGGGRRRSSKRSPLKVNKYWDEDVNVVREEGCTDGPEGDG